MVKMLIYKKIASIYSKNQKFVVSLPIICKKVTT